MGYVDLVQLMMNSGAFIDTIDNDGNTPLISAVNKGNIAVSTLLLESGCDADITNQVISLNMSLCTHNHFVNSKVTVH